MHPQRLSKTPNSHRTTAAKNEQMLCAGDSGSRLAFAATDVGSVPSPYSVCYVNRIEIAEDSSSSRGRAPRGTNEMANHSQPLGIAVSKPTVQANFPKTQISYDERP